MEDVGPNPVKLAASVPGGVLAFQAHNKGEANLAIICQTRHKESQPTVVVVLEPDGRILVQLRGGEILVVPAPVA
jgi:hypothetical protein